MYGVTKLTTYSESDFLRCMKMRFDPSLFDFIVRFSIRLMIPNIFKSITTIHRTRLENHYLRNCSLGV